MEHNAATYTRGGGERDRANGRGDHRGGPGRGARVRCASAGCSHLREGRFEVPGLAIADVHAVEQRIQSGEGWASSEHVHHGATGGVGSIALADAHEVRRICVARRGRVRGKTRRARSIQVRVHSPECTHTAHAPWAHNHSDIDNQNFTVLTARL